MRVKYACIVTKVEKKGIEEIQRMTSKPGGDDSERWGQPEREGGGG